MTERKKIVFTVTNDLNYDQRMQRICSSLVEAGHKVTLVGRMKKNSKPLTKFSFEQKRLSMLFEKGKLFYAEYNLRLFLYLLGGKYTVIGAIDLDSILACALAAKFNKVDFTYDAHEYFAELPEVVERPVVKRVWKAIERWAVPKAKKTYTINQSYADLFEGEYDRPFDIVRNATVLGEQTFALPENYILYQGAVNVGRGVEEMILAMEQLDTDLIICGAGPSLEACKQLVKDKGLEKKVHFKGYVDPQELKHYTAKARLGFTLFSDVGVSYQMSLANRFFDYMHYGIPQLVIDFPEYRRINEEFEVAKLVKNLEVDVLVAAANDVLQNDTTFNRLRQNCLKAREKYNWQAEAITLKAIYDSF